MRSEIGFGSPRRGPATLARTGAEAGFTLVALMATVAITLIAMTVAVSAWRYVMKNDREQELLFRGFQIADAIQRYQAKNANGLPISLEVLVKGRFLRKAYTDPMTKNGKWRLLRPGEVLAPTAAVSPPSSGAAPAPSPSPPTLGSLGGSSGLSGPFVGVASTSKERSLRLLNGRSRYNEWFFAVGQPRVVGKLTLPSPAAGPGAAPKPSPSP